MESIDLADAREYPGLALVATAGGKLFVSTDESTAVTRFAGDGTWTEEARIGFDAYGPPDMSGNIFVAEDRAYMPYDVSARVIWDPQAMETDGDAPASDSLVAERDGLSLRLGYGHATRDDGAFQAFYWSDDDFFAPPRGLADRRL